MMTAQLLGSRSRVIALALFACVCATSSAAFAGDVGYNLESETFSGPLPHGEEFKITLTDQPGSTATLQYWPRERKASCGSAPSSVPTYSARSVQTKDGVQTLAFDMPKLYPRQHYCFKFTVERRRAFNEREKTAIAGAMESALEKLSDGPLNPQLFSNDCNAQIQSNPETVPTCSVAELFSRGLETELRDATIVGENEKRETLTARLQRELAGSPSLTEELNGIYRTFVNKGSVKPKLEFLQEDLKKLATAVRTLPAETPTLQAMLDTLQFRPSDGTDANTIETWRKKQLDPAFKDIAKLAPCDATRRLPRGATKDLWRALCFVTTDSDDLVQALQEREAKTAQVAKSATFSRFVAALQRAVKVSKEPIASGPTQGPREKAFPFYASVDVGAGPVFFAPGTVNFAQYFAVNFYVTAVDPDAPFSKDLPDKSWGKRLARRLSFSLGITTTGAAVKRKGVSGVLGEQFLVLGAGLRLTRVLRASGGIMVFMQENLNPVVDHESPRVAPYLALSLDVAFFNWAKGLAGK